MQIEMSPRVYDMFNKIASGSFHVDGMIILPCSMVTLGKIVNGTSDHLLIRACDVQLKEQRKVLLAFQETPLSSIHLNNLVILQQAEAIIFPLVPAFYHHPKTLEDVINQIVYLVLIFQQSITPNGRAFKKRSQLTSLYLLLMIF